MYARVSLLTVNQINYHQRKSFFSSCSSSGCCQGFVASWFQKIVMISNFIHSDSPILNCSEASGYVHAPGRPCTCLDNPAIIDYCYCPPAMTTNFTIRATSLSSLTSRRALLLDPLSQQSTVGLADPTKLAQEHITSSCSNPVSLADQTSIIGTMQKR